MLNQRGQEDSPQHGLKKRSKGYTTRCAGKWKKQISLLGLSSLFAFKVRKELPPKLSTAIIEAQLLVNVLDLLHITGR